MLGLSYRRHKHTSIYLLSNKEAWVNTALTPPLPIPPLRGHCETRLFLLPEYTVALYTGYVWHAGTDANVYIKIRGSLGVTRKIELDKSGDDRERGRLAYIMCLIEQSPQTCSSKTVKAFKFFYDFFFVCSRYLVEIMNFLLA